MRFLKSDSPTTQHVMLQTSKIHLTVKFAYWPYLLQVESDI